MKKKIARKNNPLKKWFQIQKKQTINNFCARLQKNWILFSSPFFLFSLQPVSASLRKTVNSDSSVSDIFDNDSFFLPLLCLFFFLHQKLSLGVAGFDRRQRWNYFNDNKRNQSCAFQPPLQGTASEILIHSILNKGPRLVFYDFPFSNGNNLFFMGFWK